MKRRWYVAVAVVLVAGLVLYPRRPEAPAGSPNFVVIVPDTFRADRLAQAPRLQALADGGVRFTEAYSQGGWTLPALASLLTGRFPLVADQSSGSKLSWIPKDARSVPTILGYYGYHTVVFWGQTIGGIAPEFSAGFDDVLVETGEHPDPAAPLISWLGTTPKEPFFALVHNVDLQFIEAGADGGVERTYQRELATLGQAAARDDVIRRYDAGVKGYDAAIGRMVDGLRTAGVADRTVVIVTSNHGIDLGERGGFQHGTTFDTNLHVPLVISDPTVKQGQRVDTVAQTIDLAPTILTRAGVTLDQAMVGQPLQSLYGQPGPTYSERPVYSLCGKYNISLRTRRWKVQRIVHNGQFDHLLFDLSTDPGETRELFHQNKRPDGDLIKKLDTFGEQREAESAGNRGSWDAGLADTLRKYGYWNQVAGGGDKVAAPK